MYGKDARDALPYCAILYYCSVNMYVHVLSMSDAPPMNANKEGILFRK